MAAKPRSIRQLMQKQSTLKPLYAEVRLQKQLLSQVQSLLPANLARHCREARLNGSVLSLFTDTPVWANKLRFLAPKLLSSLRGDYPALGSIVVKTHVAQRAEPISIRRHKFVANRSDKASAYVAESAGSVSSPALSQALLRLARALRKT